MPLTTVQPSQVAAALSQSPIPALRKLSIRESDGSVTIVGKVPSYYMKQLAQEAVLPLLAGRSLVNGVTVVRG